MSSLVINQVITWLLTSLFPLVLVVVCEIHTGWDCTMLTNYAHSEDFIEHKRSR